MQQTGRACGEQTEKEEEADARRRMETLGRAPIGAEASAQLVTVRGRARA